MILCKRDYTADIFLGIFKIFWTNYLTKQLQTTDCKGGFFCLEHQMIIVFVELRKGNFLKNFEHDSEHVCKSFSEIMSNKEFII